jgi:hypothetical protein
MREESDDKNAHKTRGGTNVMVRSMTLPLYSQICKEVLIMKKTEIVDILLA